LQANLENPSPTGMNRTLEKEALEESKLMQFREWQSQLQIFQPLFSWQSFWQSSFRPAACILL